MDHVNAGLTIAFGIITSVVGFMFDTPPATLLAILGGASMGVAIKRPVGLFNGLIIVICCTGALAWVLPAFTDNPTTQKAIGVVAALVISGGRDLLPSSIDKVFNAGVDQLIAVIKSIGKREPSE